MKTIFILSICMMSLYSFAADIDLKKSEFKWKGTKITGEHHGTVKLKSAKVTDKSGMITSGTFIVDLNTIEVKELSGEWKGKFLGHIKSPDFFDTKKFPTAKLSISSVKNGKLFGNLTIKGKTNPIIIPFYKKESTYIGTMTFDRTKFGLIYGSGDFMKNLGDKMIHNEVNIDFKIISKK
jgi:polyisoprenoid-binding protein YceI